MDIEVILKNKKRYKTAKHPLHQTQFWTWLIWILSKRALIGKDYVDIFNENDFFYCRPTQTNVISKLAFATKELYLRSQAEKPAAAGK